MHLLETFSLQGFRSIKKLDNFALGPITVLIGANGSGKSNLIGFFRMMNDMMLGGLQPFLQSGGGASNFLHFERWTPKTRPVVKIDFCQSAVDKKEQTYESETQTAWCGLQGQSGIRSPGGA